MAAEEMRYPASRLLVAVAVSGMWLAAAGSASAYDFAAIKPLDIKALDPAMLNDIYGAWEIRSRDGTKRCRIVLSRGPAIGGFAVDVAQACARQFPVMADIAGWRLLENWTIDLIDPLRKTRVRFQSPDDRYVAFGASRDIAGMDELVKLPDGKSSGKQ